MRKYSVLSLLLVFILLLGVLAGSAAAASPYQIRRTVEIMAAYNPGGSMDAYCRVFQPFIQENLRRLTGQQDLNAVVVNMTGAAGRIAYTEIFRERDPHAPRFVLFGSTSHFWEIVTPSPTFFAAEYTFLGSVMRTDQYIMVRPDLGIENFDDLLAFSQRQPILFGTSGVAASEMLFAEFLRTMLADDHGVNLDIAYVHYSGVGEITGGFLANDIEMTIGNTVNVTQYLASNAAVPIGVIARERSAEFPDVPTLIELGVPADVVGTLVDVLGVSFRFVGSPVMDPALADVLREAIKESALNPELVAEANRRGLSINFVDWEQDLENSKIMGATFERFADLLDSIVNQ